MAIKKSELYSTLWKCCDELRGGMDASQYKDYVLVILFVKYISDKSRSDNNFNIQIPNGCHFEDFVALKGKHYIGEEMNKKMAKLAEANYLDGVFIADFDDEVKLGKGKDKVDTLSNLIAVFQNENLDFSKNRAADDDLIGDAYEYLMKEFATLSGKSKGQFYTPGEVSRVMAKVIGLNNAKNGRKTTIYDPTCGSGSLLLRAMNETPEGATVYGQEKDNTTIGLAKMNMILHNEIYADIRQGDTINDPQFLQEDKLKTFDYIVANPPFSTKSWLKSAKAEDKYHRWGESINIGIPPEKNGDYAFLLHIVRSLNRTGCAACILPHGVLFRGNAEAHIRKYLVAEKRYIKGIIGLPANLFYGTGIPACIIIIEKSQSAERKGIFMIDAKNGYIKDRSKNRLREQDIRKIVDVWQAQRDIDHYARFVSIEEIEHNDYNLNIPRYISAPDTEILQDIDAHLYGGLPKHDIDQLEDYWNVCPSLREALFYERSDRKCYYSLNCEQDLVRDIISENSDFKKQNIFFENSFIKWCNLHRKKFQSLSQGFAPKLLIEQISSSLLEVFKEDKSLVNAYDVFDCLMNYWSETMQDDCYIISSGGWTVQLETPQPASKKNEGEKKAKKAIAPEDVVCDLLPVSIVIEEFFAKENKEIINKEELLDQKENELSELIEENTENYFDEDNFENNKINDSNIKKRIKILDKKADKDEIDVLEKYLKLKKEISEVRKVIKELKLKLLLALDKKYKELTEEEIKRLVIENKWFASLQKHLESEMQRISQQLTSKISSLAERYSQTLQEIDNDINSLEEKVAKHLQQMGY